MHFQICSAFQAFTKLKKSACGTCTHLAKFLQDAVSMKAIYAFLSPHKNQTTLDEPIQMYLGLCGSQTVLAKPIHALLDFYRIQTALTEPLQLFTGICGKQIVRSRSTHFFLGLCWMQTDLDNLINTIPCLCIMQIMLPELIHVSAGFCTTETALSDSLYAFPDQYGKKTFVSICQAQFHYQRCVERLAKCVLFWQAVLASCRVPRRCAQVQQACFPSLRPTGTSECVQGRQTVLAQLIHDFPGY